MAYWGCNNLLIWGALITQHGLGCAGFSDVALVEKTALANNQFRFPFSKCPVQFTHPFVQFTLIVGSMVSSPY
jgi:hypothetical protein